MGTYAIGDIQGCIKSLRRLLDHISFDPHRDRLWLVGDLVNRGPDSLATLRFLKSLGSSVFPVLGNHDLFLMAAAKDIVTLRPKDTIQDILAADDRSELIDWLRRQPLHRREGEFFMVHAGLLPNGPSTKRRSWQEKWRECWPDQTARHSCANSFMARRLSGIRRSTASNVWSASRGSSPASEPQRPTVKCRHTPVRRMRHQPDFFPGSVFPTGAAAMRPSSPVTGRP